MRGCLGERNRNPNPLFIEGNERVTLAHIDTKTYTYASRSLNTAYCSLGLYNTTYYWIRCTWLCTLPRAIRAAYYASTSPPPPPPLMTWSPHQLITCDADPPVGTLDRLLLCRSIEPGFDHQTCDSPHHTKQSDPADADVTTLLLCMILPFCFCCYWRSCCFLSALYIVLT